LQKIDLRVKLGTIGGYFSSPNSGGGGKLIKDVDLLKAQILSEGFANDGGEKACLEKILHMEVPIDESIRQRAITQLDAIQERDTTGKI
jgi:hypothetical protein